MNRIVTITGALTRGLFGGIHLLWRWALNTALVSMLAAFAIFLATENVQQFDLAFFQELFRGYVMLAALGVAAFYLMSSAVWYFFGNRMNTMESGSSMSSHQETESYKPQ